MGPDGPFFYGVLMQFENKVVLITGGNRGIGLAAAIDFAAEGGKIAIAARNNETGIKSASDLNGIFIQTDVSKEAHCRNAVAETVAKYGRLDILVNCAGIIYRNRNVENTSLDEWNRTFDTNVKGTFLMTKYAIPELRKTKGSVVNLSSYVGLVGFKGASAYAASKAAIVNFTRSAALDYASEGVRINCVCPGSVATDMIEQAWIQHGDYEEAKRLWESKHPIGRIASPEEISKAILFLAGNGASFITGAALPVDGGLTAE